MSRLGIAGTDEQQRIRQAQLGIAGEVKGKNQVAARFGISGLNDRQIIGAGEQVANFGVAGLSTRANVAVADVNIHPAVTGSMGVAGNVNGRYREELVDAGAIKRRDEALAAISHQSERLGDRAARRGWRKGVWFADFTYIMRQDGNWRTGREHVFARPYRDLPLYIDSCGYRRVLTGTAPEWAKRFEVSPLAIETLDPDGYAAWDNPTDRAESLAYLRELMALYPNDPRL